MKNLPFILIVIALFSFTCFYKAAFPVAPLSMVEARQKIISYKHRLAIGCSPGFSEIDFSDTANRIPLLPGWGNYRMPVIEANDSAYIYFEQGINMYYGFHVIESLASFEKAIQFDSNFAMAYWGKALAYGPNINDFGYAASPDALTAIRKAKELSGNCTAAEKGLIDAIQVRYSDDTTQTREHLNQLYADAMKYLHYKFISNEDIGALYADALMIQHPWDFYDKNGNEKSWTPEIVNTIKAVLKKDPHHPGAAHYYIHAIEASNHPENGINVAKQLAVLMPGVAHIVHMPSHIFIRSGYYKEGVQVNEQAVKGYYDYLKRYAPVVNNAPLYLMHNLHMLSACANMDGRYKVAMKASIDCKNSFDVNWLSTPGFFGIFVQYVYMTPLLTDIRFGKWDDILNANTIPDSLVYANLLWHYGRGLAFARKHDVTSANSELKKLQEKLTNDQLKAEAPVYANEGIFGARLAEKILLGVIREEQNDPANAVKYLTEAVEIEDSMKYNEPRDWVHPARQYLGRVLLKAKQYDKAEKIFKEDLKINPNNGWSLTGLALALDMQHKKNEYSATEKEAKAAFVRADTHIKSSAF